ncbi:AAA family ATPase [Rhodoplanes sp. SY1]|uniref:AAA family ATPase n=1 Tax=Rhodoplanes sp. SY1 TaxID=3166646 RepID=UPI0038B51F52
MSQFCETSVTTTVFGMLDAARLKMKCGVLIGPSGVGKTFACTHYVAQNRGDAWILTATSASGNAAQNLFRKFCRLVSDDYDSEFRIAESGSIAEIQDRLRAYNFAGRLLVIDEAQNLSAQGIRELLTLNDSSDLSVIFCGNE